MEFESELKWSEVEKVKLQVQMSIDGDITGLNGEMDWKVGWNLDDKFKKYVDELTQSVDTILLGRKIEEYSA